jgi:amino acid transporter
MLMRWLAGRDRPAELKLWPVFCLGGLAFVNGARVSPAVFPPAGAIVYAGALILRGYEGFELIANASEDARDPGRTLPQAHLIARRGTASIDSSQTSVQDTEYAYSRW